jgi:hypothetical protein
VEVLVNPSIRELSQQAKIAESEENTMLRWLLVTQGEDDDAQEEIDQYFGTDGESDGDVTRRVIENDGWRNSDTGLLNQLESEEKLSFWDRFRL